MNNRLQKFFLGTIIMSIIFWQIAFESAMFGIFSFNYVLLIIAGILAFFLAFFFLPKEDEPKISKLSYLILLLPILWFITGYYEGLNPEKSTLTNISFLLEIFIIIFGLPFLVFMSIIQDNNEINNTISNKKAYLLSIIIAVIIGFIGFLFGINAKYILKCDDLRMSSYSMPSYCITEVSSLEEIKQDNNKEKKIEEKKYTEEEIKQYMEYYYNKEDGKYYFPNN